MAEGKKLVNIVRGDSENLSGEVIVYSKLKSPIEQRLYCVYATNNYQKYREVVQDKTFGEIEMTSRIFGEFLGNTMHNFNFSLFDPYLEKDKVMESCDIYESKEGDNIDECRTAVIECLTNYISSYVNQLKRKFGESKSLCVINKEADYLKFLKSLTESESRKYGFLKHLIDEYITADRENNEETLYHLDMCIERLYTGENFLSIMNKIKRIIHKSETSEDITRNYSVIEELLRAACKNPKERYPWGNPPKSPFD